MGHAIGGSVSHLTSYDARVEVPHDHDLSQVVGRKNREHVVDMGGEPDSGNIGPLEQS